MSPKKNKQSTVDEVYVIWALISGLIFAWEISQFQNTGAEINFDYIFQILILLVKDSILGGIVAGVYKIVKPFFKIIGL